MRWLALVSLLALAACSDAGVMEPESEATFSAASAPWLVLTWQETFDQPFAGESTVTPSGILHMKNIDNGFFVSGDLVGYVHAYGRAMIDLGTGRGNGSGTSVYQLTEPGIGTLECNWHSKIAGFPVFVQHGEFTCGGTGYFEGWKVKISGNNVNNPGIGIYDAIGEVR